MLNVIIKIFILALFILNGMNLAFSQEKDDAPFYTSDAEAALDAEFQWLRAEAVVMTDIATKTKMDADMVPGIVSVLDGKEMERRGARTVWDALSLTPGVDTFRYRAIMRGIGYSSNVNIKALLNGVPVNASMDGGFFALYHVPMSQVERIEVIRGPGSALYGKFAYAGVINVVTRKEGNRLYGSYGSFDYQSGGLLASYADPDNDFHISLNIAGWKRDDTEIVSGPDILYGTENEDISLAPGPVDDSREIYSGVMRVEYHDFSLLAQAANSDMGHDFGMENALPPLDDQSSQTDGFQTVRIGWESPEISQSLQFNIYGAWYHNIWEFENQYLYPPGYYGVYEDGMIGNLGYEESALSAGLDIHWKGWENHAILLGLEYEKSRIEDAWAEANFDMLDYSPLSYMERFEGDESWIDDDTTRQVGSVFIQDQVDITERLRVTAGLRYDWYDDTEDRLTPRIAGVFKASDHHIFKAQYGEAFRPASLDEMYSTAYNPVGQGNPELSAEIIRTYELAYIFKKPVFTSKCVLFLAELEDLMKWDLVENKFINSGSAETKGAELELRWNIARYLTADANISYADAETKDPEADMANIANWLGNMGLMYQATKNLSFAAQYHYIGERVRAEDDPRDKLPEYHVFDITSTFRNLLTKNLSLQAGIRNLFDEDVRYPSRYPGYIEDYPTTGRNWWVQLSYDF